MLLRQSSRGETKGGVGLVPSLRFETVSLTQRLADPSDRFLQVSLDERGGNPHDAVAKSDERSIAPSVLPLSTDVGGVIDFNDELPRRSTEVDDIELLSSVTENHLAAKANAELTPFQSGPELRLERRRSEAHPSSKELETSAVALSGAPRRRREGSERRRARHGQPFRPARGPGTTTPGAGAVPEARPKEPSPPRGAAGAGRAPLLGPGPLAGREERARFRHRSRSNL